MGWGEPHRPVATTLTREMVDAAIERIRQGRPPCGSALRPHVVHPSVARNGWAVCADCFQCVRVD